MVTPSEGERPLRLLSLDGGGIRGLSELLIVKGVMHRLMVEENKERKRDGRRPLSGSLPKPCDYFDLIGGTSTGGIIALLLGRLRMDIDMAIRHYDNLAEYVFSEKKKWGDGKFKTRKLEDAVRSVVKDMTGDSESPLLESDESKVVCRTFVCAMNAHDMTANIPTLFRTYQSHETHLDCKIWEAARATSAAPTLFKRIEIAKQPFIDGGLGRNNPSRLVLDEAKRLFGSRRVGLLLSVGTGMAKTISIAKPGMFQQVVPTDVIDALKDITTDCEAMHEAMVDLFANSPNIYFRLSVDRGMQGIRFAEWERLSRVDAHTTQYLKKREVDVKLGSLVDVIRVPRGQITLEQLLSPRSPVESKDRKLCPLPVASFTGRKGILEKMHKYFESDGTFQRVFVLRGLGGSGKSQLAFKFLQECQTDKRFSDVFYVDATTKETIEMGLEAITPEQSVDASLGWLANQINGGWMLFFDNADDVGLNLNMYFPPCASGNILVTTRNRELRHYATNDSDQSVSGMEADDATKLLLLLAQAEETDENQTLAEQIVQELHHFALAVSQAGAFIHCHTSLSHYQELYRRERDSLLEHEEIQGRDPYRLAVYATWRLSYEKLDLSARSLLQICSMLHHEGISEEIFEKAAVSEVQLDDSKLQKEVMELLRLLGKRDSGWSSWEFMRVVQCLGSYSLIEHDRRNRTYGLHPLVHHWSGTTMGEKRRAMKKCVLGMIGLSIAWEFKEEDFKYRRGLLKHISNGIAPVDPPEIDTQVACRLALTYYEHDRLGDAEVLFVAVMETRKRVLGEDHPETLVSMVNLASAYRNQGRWKDAEALEVVVLEQRKRELGGDHADTLASMAHLAHTYWDQGRMEEAEELEVVVMGKMKRVLGDDHPETLVIMGNLANMYWTQGRLEEAEALEEEVMEKMKRVLGGDHPHTLRSMVQLASTYRDQGRLDDAEALQVDVVERKKRVMGEEHPDTLSGLADLAVTYWRQDRLEDAEALEVVVMETRERVLGEDHPDTVLSVEKLAATYRSQGRLEDAKVLEAKVAGSRR